MENDTASNLDELRSYVKNELARGVDHETLQSLLKSEGGWKEEEVKAVFAELGPQTPSQGQNKLDETKTAGKESSDSNSDGRILSEKSPHTTRNILLVVLLLIVIVVGGLAGYAYYAKMGPFARFATAPFAPKDFFEEFFYTVQDSQLKDYSNMHLQYELAMVPREDGAESFVPLDASGSEETQQLQNDAQRVSDVSSILVALAFSGGEYPEDLEEIMTEAVAGGFSGSGSSVGITDPATGEPYLYERGEDGESFTLSVTFETPEAIVALTRPSYYIEAELPEISGKEAVFTERSETYYVFYPPDTRSVYEQLQDDVALMGSNFGAELMMDVAVDREENVSLEADGSIQIDGASFSIGFEYVLMKNKVLYVRVSDFPMLSLFGLSEIAGKWYSITPEDLEEVIEETGGEIPLEIQSIFGEVEDTSTTLTDSETRAFLENLLSQLKTHNPLIVVGAPEEQLVEEGKWFGYNLALNVEGLRSLVRGFVEGGIAISPYESVNAVFAASMEETLSDDMLNYIESESFEHVIRYFNQNSKMTVWVDHKGVFRSLDFKARIVPASEDAVPNDHQLNVSFKISDEGLDQVPIITAPEGATPLVEIFSEYIADALIESQIASLQSEMYRAQYLADSYYEENKQLYAGVCSVSELGGGIASILESASTMGATEVSCFDADDAWAAEVYMPSEELYFCIDSVGFANFQFESSISAEDFSCSSPDYYSNE